jgi:magnesium transporter
VIIDSSHYLDGVRQHDASLSVGEAERRSREEGGFAWVTLSDPTAEEMQEVRVLFSLPELAVEDAQEGQQRPKLEQYGEDAFLVSKTVGYDVGRRALDLGEIDVFIGARHAVVVEWRTETVLAGARRRLDARRDLAQSGPMAVAWAALDEVIDAYEPVFDRLEEDFEKTEEGVLQRELDQGETIYVLRREAARLVRGLHPLLGPIEVLEQGGSPAVPDALRPLFRDIGDHVRRLYEELVVLGQVLDGLLNANLAAVSVRQNIIVQKVSGWAAIAVVPTIITGIYGMNFRHMPELGWVVGYPLAILLMIASVLGLWWHFKRVGWL